MAQNSANLNQEVIIDGKKYKLTGSVDFSNLQITKVDDIPQPNPDPEPQDPTKPNEGFIKPGGWGADLLNKAAWKVINMRDFPEQFKIVDGAGKNVATNFKTKEVAENFRSYFQNNPFPPEDTNPSPTPQPTPTPTPEPTPQPQPGGSGTTKDGVKIPYETTGKMEYKFKNNDRDDGKRMDFNSLKAGEYVNAAVLGYFSLKNVPDDEVSGKFSAVPHSGSSRTECYDMGVKNKGGDTRIRYEQIHPNYTKALHTGDKGKSLGEKFLGYLFARKTLPNGNVLCEIWQDQGDNEGSAPANNWVKLFSWEDTKYKFSNYKDGHQVTIRVDGNNIVKEMKLKWLALVEIK